MTKKTIDPCKSLLDLQTYQETATFLETLVLVGKTLPEVLTTMSSAEFEKSISDFEPYMVLRMQPDDDNSIYHEFSKDCQCSRRQ